jgi:hypothetical protein
VNTFAWHNFCTAKERFRELCASISQTLPMLKNEQQNLVNKRDAQSYIIDTPVVYNTAIDSITKEDTICLILVADNPGRKEQSAMEQRYLVGPSGKIAANFFEKELGIDFRKNVVILNKTPIHTPRTAELRILGGANSQIHAAIVSSQKQMAALLVEFYNALKVPIWIIGYSEMKKKGIFEAYTNELKNYAIKNSIDKNDVYIYRHFSMNQFTIDLNHQKLQNESIKNTLARIGTVYRNRILK